MVEEMFIELYNTTSNFLGLTFDFEAIWVIIPLFIATIINLVYSGRYKEEGKYAWSSYIANSLVLLFVSMSLFRYIYYINPPGFQNFIELPMKTIITAFLLLIGMLLLKFNFGHLLPDKISKYLSSAITVNLISYAAILFVFSPYELNLITALSLGIIILLFSILFSSFKVPLKRLFTYVEKEKLKDQLKNAKEAVYQIEELKKELKYRENELKKLKEKDADKEKKQAIKIKKILRKEKLTKPRKKIKR